MAQATWLFGVDAIPWIAPLDSPAAGAILNHNPITVTGRAEAGNLVILTLGR